MTNEKFNFDAELEEIRQKKKEGQLKPEKQDMKGNVVRWPRKPLDMTDANFNQIVQKFPIVVVDFWAPWCMPCQIVGPIIEDMAKSFREKVVFGKMNVDINQKIAAKYGIMSIPTLLIFKNGKLADQQIGVIPKKILESVIRRQI